jgi:hypothetical protein
MTIAEIRGKISAAGTNLSERMEDLLTSDVFGNLRYLPPERALLPFLCTACSFQGRAFQLEGRIVRVHTAFWPWLKSPNCIPCEPDVVLGLETEGKIVHLVAVEAKYYASLSSEEDERAQPNNQLARELDNLNEVTAVALGWNHGLRIVSRTLLFVTQDMGMPRADLARSLAEFARKRKSEGDIFWTSWRFLPSILEKGLSTESEPGRRAVLEDMLQLLYRKALTMFRGVERLAGQFTLSAFIFYQSKTRSYELPHIPEFADILCEYTYKVVRDG